MADAGQMNPNLVGAAGSDANAEKRTGRELLEHLIFGMRRAPGSELGGHARPPHWIASNRCCDCAALPLHAPMNKRQVDLFNFPALKLSGECLVSEVRSSNDEH